MKTAAVIKACILEDQTTKVTMSGYNIVRFFFLSKFIAIVLRHILSRFTYKTRRDKATVHSTKQATPKYTSNSQHMERVHENVVFSLEDQHVIKRSRNSERHCITERTLTEGVDEEYCRSCSDWSRVSNEDPGTHP